MLGLQLNHVSERGHWRQIIVVFSYRFGEYNVKMCSGNGVVKLAGRIRHMRTWVSEADIKGMDK